MFIVDAFIGNWDRHCGNWGFLYNQNTDDIQVAPIYDCGSSLFPQADEKIMEKTLESDEELKLRVYTMPWCAFRKEGRKISYYDYISSLEDSNCNQALKRVVPQINLGRIYNLIDNIEYLSKLQKEFYKTILTARKEVILDKSLEKLLHREREYER